MLKTLLDWSFVFIKFSSSSLSQSVSPSNSISDRLWFEVFATQAVLWFEDFILSNSGNFVENC